MTKDEQPPGASIDECIASLLGEIQKEPVPEKLLVLARRLQDALNDRNRDEADQVTDASG